MFYDIGTHAWIKFSTIPNKTDHDSSWYKFLIIGDFGKECKILLTGTFFGIKIITSEFLKQYKIDDQYLGKLCLIAHVSYLAYEGQKCLRCHNEFDHLEPEDGFICWGCELSKM